MIYTLGLLSIFTSLPSALAAGRAVGSGAGIAARLSVVLALAVVEFVESQKPVSGQVELTGAAVREATGIALPARYSTREAEGVAVGEGGAVAADVSRWR